MACFQPLRGWKAPGGGISFTRGDGYSDLPVLVPCGRCIGCLESRKRDWAIRCCHEASLYKQNCFVTLTYDDAHVPKDGSLVHSDFQNFAKKFRRDLGPFRYFMCGEYGPENLRPHFHSLIFGHDFSEDRSLWKRSPAGYKIFRSAVLDLIWQKGISTVQDFGYENARYVAGYCMKRANPNYNSSVYDRVDFGTGAVYRVAPEYGRMSRRPGIGKRWFDKWKRDVFPSDEVVFQGNRFRPPRYYDKQLGELELASVKRERVKRMVERAADSTPDRLAVREAILEAKVKAAKGRRER